MACLISVRLSRACPLHVFIRCKPDVKLLSTNSFLKPPLQVLPSTMAYSSLRTVNRSFFDQNRIVIFTPRRNFGRGKRQIPFGHGFEPKPSKLEQVFVIGITLTIVIPFIDWTRLHRDYGIFIPFISDAFGTVPLPAQDAIIPSSAPLVYEERKSEIHEFMQEEAARRAFEEAKSDPELKAILEGRADTIKPVDEEAFAIKKKYIQQLQAKINLKAEEDKRDDFVDFLDSDDGDEDDSRKVGFRNRKIIEYENRIRQYSTPDKIFRYFATYRVTDDKGQYEVMMTPEDFLRSITPGLKQPEHLGLDQFINIGADEINRLMSKLGLEDDSIFHELGSGGLISFSDYIFLLTVLSTSRRHFEIAFKMFDLNGDGNVDAKEFEVVTNLMKSQSSTGIRHRDHQTTGSTFKGINSGLSRFFFGDNREGILTVEKFLDFQRHLQNEILRLEFTRKLKESKGDDQRISEKDFAELLIAYAGFSAKKKSRMLKRVTRGFGGEDQQGIGLDDFLNFYQVLYAINDIDTALTFHTIAGAPIERHTMKHVAHTVAGVQLSDHVVDVVFILFDENGDGKLSNKEFVSVMKQRAMRGLEKPKDTGIGRIFSAITKCASDCKPAVLGSSRKSELL